MNKMGISVPLNTEAPYQSSPIKKVSFYQEVRILINIIFHYNLY